MADGESLGEAHPRVQSRPWCEPGSGKWLKEHHDELQVRRRFAKYPQRAKSDHHNNHVTYVDAVLGKALPQIEQDRRLVQVVEVDHVVEALGAERRRREDVLRWDRAILEWGRQRKVLVIT